MSKTSITFLLDKSGSMEAIRDDTIGAFNAYLDELKKDSEGIQLSLVLFDSISVEKVHVNRPLAEVPPLGRKVYVPHGSTPLIEAVHKTIKAVEKATEGDTDTKVIICIQTDGQENSSSREYTWDGLNAIIKEKTAAGWQFNFMGASIDAYQQASRMGIGVGQTMSYDSRDAGATKAAFVGSASNVRSYVGGQSLNTSYSTDQKNAAGDVYAAMHQANVPIQHAFPARTPAPTVKKGLVDDFEL
jgi:uncharacterized protein YegL